MPTPCDIFVYLHWNTSGGADTDRRAGTLGSKGKEEAGEAAAEEAGGCTCACVVCVCVCVCVDNS